MSGSAGESTQNRRWQSVAVLCYAGYRHAESPRRFRRAGAEINIRDITERWRSPEHDFFRVMGDDGNSYLLRHEAATGQWAMAESRDGD